MATGTLAGAAIFFWTWDGFQRTAIMANEIAKPRTTIPIAIIGGISITAIVYLSVAATTLGVLGPEATDAPVFRGAVMIFAAGGWLIIGSSWISSFSEMLGDLLATSRVGHAMGTKHELPHWLAALHPRYKIPRHALAVLTVAGVALVLLVRCAA